MTAHETSLPPPEDRRETVVLIDDDPAFARDVEAVLGGICRVVWVPGSEGALETIEAENPNLILLDLNMPRRLAKVDEEEGVEVLARMPRERRNRVVVVSKVVTKETRRRLNALGVVRVYSKTDSAVLLRRMVGESI